MSKVVAIGISPHMGWAAVASVVLAKGALRVLRTDRIATGTIDDHETVQPYHVAAGIEPEPSPPPADPAEIIRRGLEKQLHYTLASLRTLAREIGDSGGALKRGAILCGRGRNAASLERILASHTQVHIAEGLAVRDSLASALGTLRVQVVKVDRDTLLTTAAATLDLDEAKITTSLKALRPENGGLWRQEQRHAALAAWLMLARPGNRTHAR